MYTTYVWTYRLFFMLKYLRYVHFSLTSFLNVLLNRQILLVTMSDQQLQDGLLRVENFLNQKSYLLSDKQKRTLQQTKDDLHCYVNLKVNYNRHGRHFETCPYFNYDTYRNKTCNCYREKVLLTQANQLIDFYKSQ